MKLLRDLLLKCAERSRKTQPESRNPGFSYS